MKLFVDYTNWNDVREWREILPEPGKEHFIVEDGNYFHKNGDCEATRVMHVTMVDRDNARRTLNTNKIHGFKVEA